MTREQAREYINGLISSELTKAKKRVSGYDTYICPFCDNGSGSEGDGICTKDGKRYTCFKGCFSSWDYLDILKHQYNTEHERDIFSRYNLTIEDAPYRPSAVADFVGVAQGNSPPLTGEVSTQQEPPLIDYTEYMTQAKATLQNNVDGLGYLNFRGISPATAARCNVGYDPAWKSPAAIRNGNNPPPTPRLILPTGKHGYTARLASQDPNASYRLQKEGRADLFNKAALWGNVPVFITEAAIDALSIIEAGGAACALGSTNGVNKFLDLCKKQPPTAPLVLALDNDADGHKWQGILRAGLEAMGLYRYEAKITGEHKDANAHLTADRTAFFAAVAETLEAVRYELDADRRTYIETSAASHIGAFMGAVSASANTPAISTGFEKLDAALDGGLYAGLYIIGAISSLGKTTFVLQVADQIAQKGHDVLMFSLEMSRYELMAKSISRLTLDNCEGKTGDAKTTRGILAGAKWRFYSVAETDLIKRSTDKYKEYGRHIFIHEGVGDIGMAQITQEVQRHISFTGNTPIVIIDYLQIIAPHDERASDKQNTDKAVLELKRLSRDKKIPVIAISSFNRDNYTAPVNMASFKESGAVEYSSDVLLGLQLAGMDELAQSESKRAETIRKIEEKKRADPRKAQLKILKNRNGPPGLSLYYDYYPMFNSFRETDGGDYHITSYMPPTEEQRKEIEKRNRK